MSSKKENSEYNPLKSVISKLDQAKSNCNDLYKKIIKANTKEDCDELIKNYHIIIENLKQVKNESYALDNFPVPEICFQPDDEVNNARMDNYNSLLSLAQHIRGCHQAFSDYNSKIK